MNEKEQTQENAREVNVLELLGYLWTHVLLIVLATAVTAAGALLITHFLIDPTYTATAELYIITNDATKETVTKSELDTSSSLKNDFIAMIPGDTVLDAVIDELGLDTNAKTLRKSISVSGVNDARIVNITVTAGSPEKAQQIANCVAAKAQEKLPPIMKCDEPSLSAPAKLPTEKSGPSRTKNTLIGAAIGFVLSVGVILLFYFLNDTFRTGEDLHRYLGIAPLAEIPEGIIDEERKRRRRSNGNGEEQ